MKTILVSGGLGSLGSDMIKRLGQKKFRFIVVDNHQVPKNFLNDFPNSIYIKADVRKGRELSQNLSKVLKKEGIKLDGIVNTPAWSDFKDFSDTTFSAIDKIIKTKLVGYANIIKSSLPYLNDHASIVNVASVQAHSSREGTAMYSAANGGVISLTKALSVELRHRKIRLNVITPGGFVTDIYKKTHSDWEQKLKNNQCLKIADISNVIIFLLNDSSVGINGAEIIIDGGISAMRTKSSDY